MKFKSVSGNTYTLEERKMSNGNNYCLRSHHLAPIRTCCGKTEKEVEAKALKEGLKRI